MDHRTDYFGKKKNNKIEIHVNETNINELNELINNYYMQDDASGYTTM